MKSPTAFLRKLAYIWLLIFLVSIPVFCIGAQASDPDSVTVLAITRYKILTNEEAQNNQSRQIRKVSYIAKGAIISLTLTDGQEIKGVLIEEVAKDHILITGGEKVPLTSIKKIKVGESWRRTVTKLTGGVFFSIGVISTFGIISFAANLASGSFLAFLLLWIPGLVLVLHVFNKYPAFDFSSTYFSLSTVSLSSLSQKIHKKLKRDNFYHQRLK